MIVTAGYLSLPKAGEAVLIRAGLHTPLGEGVADNLCPGQDGQAIDERATRGSSDPAAL